MTVLPAVPELGETDAVLVGIWDSTATGKFVVFGTEISAAVVLC